MAEDTDDSRDVLDWYLGLDADRRELVVGSPTELESDEMERRAELAAWMESYRQDVDEESLAKALFERGGAGV